QCWIEVLQLLIVIADVDGFVPFQFSINRTTRADQSSQQRCFSRAVGAENGPSFVALDLEVDAAHQWYIFVANRKTACRQNVSTRPFHSEEREFPFHPTRLGLFYRLYSRKQLPPGLGLFSLLAGDIAANVVFLLLDPFALELPLFFLSGDAFSTLFE